MPARPSNPQTVERLGRICMTLPEATEKLSYGAAAWFVGGRQFANTSDHQGPAASRPLDPS